MKINSLDTFHRCACACIELKTSEYSYITIPEGYILYIKDTDGHVVEAGILDETYSEQDIEDILSATTVKEMMKRKGL